MTEFNKKLSIFIPRVLNEWANEEIMGYIFKKLDIGEVERVDFVEKTTEYNNIYYQAFVHFKEWCDTSITRNIQEKIMNPEQVAKIVYDDPGYWIILKNKNPMTEIEVKLEKRIIELEKQNVNQNNIMLNYLNRIINLETQINQLQTGYWNNQMSSVSNSIRSLPPPLLRQTNSHEVNFYDNDNVVDNSNPEWFYPSPSSQEEIARTNKEQRMQYESDETGNYMHRPDYEDRDSYQQDKVEDYYDYYQYDMNIIE